jgi:hypothetical protein
MKPAHWVVFNARSMRKTGCALLIGAYRKAQCAFARALAFPHRSTEAQRAQKPRSFSSHFNFQNAKDATMSKRGSVTDKGSSWYRQLDHQLDPPSVTDDGKCLQQFQHHHHFPSSVTADGKTSQQFQQCQHCPSPVTAAFRTGSYTKFLCEPCAKEEWGGESIHLGVCIHCGIPIYCSKGYAHCVAIGSYSSVCSSSCNKAARLKQRKDARSLARTARACLARGQQFVPTRTDAKTCSNKCRQAAFRAKQGRDADA